MDFYSILIQVDFVSMIDWNNLKIDRENNGFENEN